MIALKTWNGGVIIISHDEKFITTVANEVCSLQCFLFIMLILDYQLWVCGEGTVKKFKGDVQSYKVIFLSITLRITTNCTFAEPDCEQYQGKALSVECSNRVRCVYIVKMLSESVYKVGKTTAVRWARAGWMTIVVTMT